MKYLILILFFLQMSCTTATGTTNKLRPQEIKVKEAKYLPNTDQILLRVFYATGCGDHRFYLKASKICAKSYPAQSFAELIHESNNTCEMAADDEITVDIPETCRPVVLTIEPSDPKVKVNVPLKGQEFPSGFNRQRM